MTENDTETKKLCIEINVVSELNECHSIPFWPNRLECLLFDQQNRKYFFVRFDHKRAMKWDRKVAVGYAEKKNCDAKTNG